MAKTKLMDRCNVIASGYENAIGNSDYLSALRIAQRVSEFLSSLHYNEKMYGDGDKWMSAGDLLEYNKQRICRLEKSIYSLQVRSAVKNKNRYE